MKFSIALAIASIALLADSPAAGAGDTDSGLKISAEVTPTEIEEGKPIKIAAVFENVGGAPLKLFVPETSYAATFPGWRLLREDDAQFLPYAAPVQSMWTMGMQGEVVTLAPGEKRRFEHEVTDFVAVPPDPPNAHPWKGATPLPLGSGTYRVTCGHMQSNDSVPFGLADFKKETRSLEELWTGEVASAPVALRVVPSKAPRLRISAPASVVAGDPFPLEIRMENRSDKPQHFEGEYVIEIVSKRYGSLSASVKLPAGLDLTPGESRATPVELSSISFSTPPGFRAGFSGLYRVVSHGTVWISAQFVSPTGDVRIRSNGMFRRINSRPFVPEETLHLEVRPGVNGTFVVALRNAGSKPIVAPKTLAYPQHLNLALTDPAGMHSTTLSMTMEAPDSPGRLVRADALGSWAVIVEGFSWNADAFDAEAPPADATVTLQPGDEVTRSFELPKLVHGDLADLEHGGLPGRRYRIQAFWRNLDAMSAKRDDGLRVAVGGAQSAPVDIVVPPRGTSRRLR